jgi:ribulose-5-phosphate 4-epimerase/fuculose-1-phosphate aldolase
MRGHGCVVVGPNLKKAVLTSIYLKVNARLQAEAMRLGEIVFLSEGEIAKSALLFNDENPVNRMWQYWRRRAGMD